MEVSFLKEKIIDQNLNHLEQTRNHTNSVHASSRQASSKWSWSTRVHMECGRSKCQRLLEMQDNFVKLHLSHFRCYAISAGESCNAHVKCPDGETWNLTPITRLGKYLNVAVQRKQITTCYDRYAFVSPVHYYLRIHLE